MKLHLFNKHTDGNYSILIQGVIGKDVNGYEIANEIKRLSEIDAKRIQIRINSIGGSVIESYSIVAEMQAAKANMIIETVNVGVSYSSAAWILAAGTKGHRRAKKHSSAMIHNADSLNKQLEQIGTQSVQQMLAESTGKDIESIANAMTNQTFYQGNEQEIFGFVDITEESNISTIKPDMSNSLVLMNLYKESQIQINTMKDLQNRFKLPDNSTEKDVSAAIDSMENQYKTESTELKNSISAKDLEIVNLKKEIAESKTATITAMVNQAIEDGKCDKEKKDSMIEIGNKLGVEGLEQVFGAIKLPHIDVNNLLNTGNDVEGKTKDGKTKDFAWYEKNEPENLLKMETENPKMFNKLKEADEKLYI